MSPITAFSVEPLPEREDEIGRVRLVFEGRPLDLVLEGKVLEGQYAVAPGYLLLLTADCPFEESLTIYVLDRDFRILDRGELAIPTQAGILTNLRVAAADKLCFSFFDPAEEWTLTVFERPQAQPPMQRYPQRLRLQNLVRRRWFRLDHRFPG